MPVTATPVVITINGPNVTRQMVRMFLRDYGSRSNILLDTVEFTDAELDMATNMAIDEYNSMTPISSAVNGVFPANFLLKGTVAWLLYSESFLQLRNQATYNDGDITAIGVDDKTQLYSNLAQQLKAEWMAAAKQYKTQLNMQAAFGSLSSGYVNVSRFNNS